MPNSFLPQDLCICSCPHLPRCMADFLFNSCLGRPFLATVCNITLHHPPSSHPIGLSLKNHHYWKLSNLLICCFSTPWGCQLHRGRTIPSGASILPMPSMGSGTLAQSELFAGWYARWWTVSYFSSWVIVRQKAAGHVNVKWDFSDNNLKSKSKAASECRRRRETNPKSHLVQGTWQVTSGHF